MTSSASLKTEALDKIFQAGATVISHLIDKQVQVGPATPSVTESSLTLNAGWVVLTVEVPAGSLSFNIRFDAKATMQIVKLMMGGGEELGAIGDSMTSEITAQIASTMAEELASQNGWQANGIVAKICEDVKLLPPPPLHTCIATFDVEGAGALNVAVDFDMPTANKANILLATEAAAAPAAASKAAPEKRAAKTPQAAAFTQMTPNAGKASDGASLELVRDVPMTVRALLGSSRLQLREVVGMQSGTVFELNRSSEEPIDLYVNNILIARGEVVVVDDRYAVKISELNPGSSAR